MFVQIRVLYITMSKYFNFIKKFIIVFFIKLFNETPSAKKA